MKNRFGHHFRALLSEALKQLYSTDINPNDISFQETKKEFSGDITLVVFPFTKFSKKSPEQTAQDLGAYLSENSGLTENFNVVKGFLNISIKNEFWLAYFKDIAHDLKSVLTDDQPKQGAESTLMVEYSSPNTNKPLHLGHVRNNLLGLSVSKILKAAGHKVIMVNLVNDRGVHICKSMLAWQKFGKGETPESSGLKGDHLVGKYYVLYDQKLKEEIAGLVKEGMQQEDAEKNASLSQEVQEMLRKWEANDAEVISLWKKMNSWVYKGFDETYKNLGVSFDKIYYESETYLLGKKIVNEGLEAGAFYKKDDGSVWVDLADAGLDQKVLLRSDGTSVYITQDMGTAQLRFDEYPNLQKLIYVVGNEQDYHFKVLIEIFKKLKRSWAGGLHHLSYGMVDLPSGKMKSREGTVVDADELIKEITESAEMTTKALGKLDNYDDAAAKKLYHDLGMGALKYFILKVDPKKRMLFNPAESIDLNGNTGPFIQYTYARIKSVLAKGAGQLDNKAFESLSISPEEKALIRILYDYPATIRSAAEAMSPAQIANYAYELAKAYNHFYHDHIIVDSADGLRTSFRLNLSQSVAFTIQHALDLLGISAPERM
ncbi:MAG: arginine--tRNA ligase [Bacteroidetes bacterium]|nr:MAG: arginine--tRNA ligase [Bacteroidota bacterium]REJ99916.1 MAG: arginine--tRNA ligase [Bacteroidota bacterium]REK35904.1 MAG: arginine--tRNA ligase [Bacteroidota bacterium]